MAPVLAFLLLTYVVASIPFSVVITTMQGGEVDIRTAGSGNPGATNAARLYGWRVGGIVMALDILKGLVPVLLARALWPEWDPFLGGVVALVAFCSHVFPAYLELRGGKGVATSAGGMLALAPVPTLGAAGVWTLVLLITGRSSLAALCATVAMVGFVWWLQIYLLPLMVVLGLAIAVTHLPNIRRLAEGKEQRVIRPVRWSQEEGPALTLLDQDPAGNPLRQLDPWPVAR